MDYPFDIKSELSQTDFVLKTQRQIIKDFGTVGIDFSNAFSELPLSLEKILDEIQAQLRILNSNNGSSFTQLLYRIDIPESQFAAIAKESDAFEQLSFIILKREAYKVFLRRNFA